MINALIRSDREEVYKRITGINNLDFNQTNEGILISKLRESGKFIPELSLVAEYNNRLTGHLLFYPFYIVSMMKRFKVLSLAPVAVLPEFQKKGTGSKLI